MIIGNGRFRLVNILWMQGNPNAVHRVEKRISLRCPKCRGEGAAQIIEQGVRWLSGKMDYKIASLTKEFSAFNPGTHSYDVKIYCIACAATVWPII